MNEYIGKISWDGITFLEYYLDKKIKIE